MIALWVVLAAAPCFEVREPTAGWKRVELTEATPALRTFDERPQFRSGEPVWVTERKVDLYRSGLDLHHGVREFELELPPGARRLTLVFQESLRGAKVDATSWGMELLHEHRVKSEVLVLQWGSAELKRLWVRVHHHLRKAPVLMNVTVEREVLPATLGLPVDLQAPRSLYFFQAEPDQRVVLCHSPGEPLHVTQEALANGWSVQTIRLSR